MEKETMEEACKYIGYIQSVVDLYDEHFYDFTNDQSIEIKVLIKDFEHDKALRLMKEYLKLDFDIDKALNWWD